MGCAGPAGRGPASVPLASIGYRLTPAFAKRRQAHRAEQRGTEAGPRPAGPVRPVPLPPRRGYALATPVRTWQATQRPGEISLSTWTFCEHDGTRKPHRV